jgi:hypothetical protein
MSPVYALRNAASLFEVVLGEREVGLTLGKEGLSINREVCPRRTKRHGPLRVGPWQSGIIAIVTKFTALSDRDTCNGAPIVGHSEAPRDLNLDCRIPSSMKAYISSVA